MEESIDGCSFWEPEFYKKTTKRVEDGFRLCNDFTSMLEERAEIEKNYAKSLQNWSKKWQDTVVKSHEKGEMKKGWLALLEEASNLSEIHLAVRQGLEEYVIENIKLWSKETYHKSLMAVKEKRDIDDAFKRVQKPWTNQLAKIRKSKSLYYDACRNEKKAKKFKENGTLALSEEQLTKIDERIAKAQEESLRCKDNYLKSISELNEMKPKYVEEMRFGFHKCQSKEGQRLKFFSETLLKLYNHVNISKNSELPKIYEKYLNTVQGLNHERDLKWWAINFGDEMPFRPPKFEEFIEVVEPIKKSNSLMRAVIKRDNSVYKTTTMPIVKPSSSVTDKVQKCIFRSNSESVIKSKKPVRVKALYDYVANAFDELSLKEGDVFDKLEDEDDLGWCKGFKDGKVGLYPANYVQVLTMK